MERPCSGCAEIITGAAQRRFCRTCRTARDRRTTRWLSPGEQVPTDEPGRYPSSHGYVRLRWRIGAKNYVETYEHRVINGRVTSEDHVHHVNHHRADNSPANLRPLSAVEHHAVHADVVWRAEAVRLYRTGLSTYQVSDRVGRDASTVYRALVDLGEPLRTEARIAIPHRERNRHVG